MIVNYKDVSILQEKTVVLQKVNFKAAAKDFVFITGKVGSGKSTFLKSLYAAVRIEGEKAQVIDFDLLSLKAKRTPDLRRQLGIIFQNFQLLPDRTVYANLDFVLKATGWGRRDARRERIEEVLEAVHLSDKAEKYPHELSGGEQQRTSIARAILNKPQLIIADEPTGNLDVEASHQIVDILQSLREQGTTIIMSTHNLQLLDWVDNISVFHCENQHMLRTRGIAPADEPEESEAGSEETDRQSATEGLAFGTSAQDAEASPSETASENQADDASELNDDMDEQSSLPETQSLEEANEALDKENSKFEDNQAS
ncbi:MAG: ATP-binding cassette domain-containing protein [Prevotellaceae bacterium]|nr:ATP-binding cassette domain-containing protein [Prevotellaceae bacterium]MDY3857022.1 ATP-binding cassette domain-containing protein [Bacteroidaceae bacterium]